MINLAQTEEVEKIENSYKPIASSYQKYAFHDETEIPIIDDLRNWSYEYFKMLKIYETLTRVPEMTASYKDFDVQGKIVHAEQLDDISRVLTVRDISGQTFKIRINSHKFYHSKVGAVVRLRSVQLKSEE